MVLKEVEGHIATRSPVGKEYQEALEMMPLLMERMAIAASDLDKTYLDGGIVPRNFDGSLDLERLDESSPYTLPILRNMAILELHGIPFPTETGKSFTALLIAKLQKQIKYDYAYKLGMLEQPYIADSKVADFNFSGILRIKPEFQNTTSGYMKALSPDHTTPSDSLLVVSYFGLDNSARIINVETGERETSAFPDSFYSTFLHPEIVQLLRDTTRDSKKERQHKIMQRYYRTTTSEESFDLWTDAVELTSDFSYASPDHGAKFNLELGLIKILKDEALRKRWIKLAESLGVIDYSGFMHNSGELSTDFASANVAEYVKQTLLALFPPEVASVTINHVDEGNKGMGKRTVIDLNPPSTNKHTGFLKIVASLNRIYKQSNLIPPKFLSKRITLGDGPSTNDESLICLHGGWTNTAIKHVKFDGFPVYNRNLMRVLNIGIKKHEELSRLEHTALFTSLLVYHRLRIPVPMMPEKLENKIILPSYYRTLT